MRPPEKRRPSPLPGGHLIIKNFFPQGEITRVRTAQDAYYQGHINTTPDFKWPPPRPTRARCRKHPYASFFRSELATLLRDGRLARLICEQLKLPKIRFWHDQLLYEEPRTEAEENYHWHREESRWRTCAASQMLTAWIPLTDFTPAMGPLSIMSGGKIHRIALNSGDLILFSSTTLHGNPPNLGHKPRRALAAHFASADLHYQKNGKFRHVNERLVRRVNGLPDFSDPSLCPLMTPQTPPPSPLPVTETLSLCPLLLAKKPSPTLHTPKEKRLISPI